MHPKGFILAIDDDAPLVKIVEQFLTAHGYKVRTAASAFQARGALVRFKPDLVILDRGLPDTEGAEFIKEIRAHQESLPVLFLTGKSSPTEKVEGLRSGGDDYLTKPFATEELLARIEVLLKRSRMAPRKPVVLRARGITVDLIRHSVEVNRKMVALAPKEYELLVALLEKPGHTLSRRFLLERVWGADKGLDMNLKTVNVALGRLRKALGSWGNRIVAIKSYGFRVDSE